MVRIELGSRLQTHTVGTFDPSCNLGWLGEFHRTELHDVLRLDAAEAEHLVSCMRYPPVGSRSFGPTRANFSAGAGYADGANDQILAIAMIETAEALENLEDIVSTPGLDGVYVGPADLALGATQGRLRPGLDREEDEMITRIQSVLSAAKSAGLRAGIHCGSPDYAARAIGWGYDFVSLSNDVRMLAAAAASAVDQTRQLLGQGQTADDPNASGGY